MPSTLDRPSVGEFVESLTSDSSELELPWLLVVYDDPVNTMGFVAMVFEKVLSMPRSVAEKKMWEVHTKGKSVVWEGGREQGEVFLQQLHLYGLQARMERAGAE